MAVFESENENLKMQEKKQIFCFALFCFFVALFFAWMHVTIVEAASAPSVITYQGKLLDDGLAVDDTVAMGFLIYDDVAAGDILYTASGTTNATDTVNIVVDNGIFSVDLGTGDTNDLDANIFAENDGLYLEVWVDGTALSPRKRITAAPFALNSSYLMGYGVATASTSEYIPRSDGAGNFSFTGTPVSDDVSGGSVFINPGLADPDTTVFGVAVAGIEKFRVDENGNVWVAGSLTATGTAVTALSELTVAEGLTLGGVRHTEWPAGGTGDVVAADDNNFSGVNTFGTTSTFNGIALFASTSQFVGTSTMENLVINDSITLDGVEITSWPAGGVGDVVAADDNGFLGVNTFAATSTFNGPVIFSATTTFSVTSTMADLIVTGGITLGGEERTTWPVGGSGDVVAADDNVFTGQNTFSATSTLATSTISELTVSSGVTIGGVRRTSWPGGVGLDDDNIFTGVNTFNGGATFNGNLNSGALSFERLDDSATDITSFAIQGNYAFSISETQDTLTVTDISGTDVFLTQVGTLTDHSNLDGALDIAVQGNYAYITAGTTAILTVVDISDPTAPVVVGSLTSGGSLWGAKSIVVSGNYAYVAASSNDKFTIVDISNPLSPFIAGTLADGGGGSPYFNGINSIYIFDHYAFVTAEYSHAVNVIDISDKSNPVYLTSAIDDAGGFTSLEWPKAITGIGNHIFVGTFSEGLQIIDISDPTSLVAVDSYDVGGGVNSLWATNNYLYIRGQGGYSIINISDPTTPTAVMDQAAGGSNWNNGVHSIFIKGNNLYISLYESDSLEVYSISTAVLATADIGAVSASHLVVEGGGSFGGSVDVRGGLSVGNSGFLLNGNFSMFAPTSSLASTNTLHFSHTALFETFASTTDDHAFIFNTKNSFTIGASKYLFSVRNNGTPTFSISTNGDVRATGTYYGAAVAVSMPGAPGDLAERVDIAIDDEVEAGDVVVVDPNNTDTYRRSTAAYMQEVSGVISTNPTIVVGDGRTENTAVMAMVGRVPIKASNENGAIARGDLLVTASIKGYAMKYDSTKDTSGHVASIVGVALEGLVGETGKIMGLVRTGWVDGGTQNLSEIRDELSRLALAQTNMSAGAGFSVEENDDGTIGTVATDVSFNGFSLLAVKSVHGENDKWSIDEQGRFITTVETSEGEKTLYALQTGESQYVFSGNGRLVDGRVTIEFDPAVQDIIDTNKAMSINLTLTARANGIFVSRRDEHGFDVEEMNGGESDATFDWLVFATRKGEGDEVVTSTPENVSEDEDESEGVVEENVSDDVSTPTSTPEQEVLIPEDEVSSSPEEPVELETPVDVSAGEPESVVDQEEASSEEVLEEAAESTPESASSESESSATVSE